MEISPGVWCYMQPEEAVERVVGIIEGRRWSSQMRRWLIQGLYRIVSHLAGADYGGSWFIGSLGLSAEASLVVISEGERVEIEYLVYCSDGSCVSRAEALDGIGYIPTPGEIREECRLIREGKPLTSYGDMWCGVEGPGVRDIGLHEFGRLED